jgi:hypothetical protein
MSMPREDAYGQLRPGPDQLRTVSPPDRSRAAFVGRVGALVLGLGLGAAVAGTPGIALADTDGSGSAPPGAASSSTSHDPPTGKRTPTAAVSADAPGNGTRSSAGTNSAAKAEARDAEARDAEARDADARDAEARDAEARDAEARDADAVEEGPTGADPKPPETTEISVSTEAGSMDRVASKSTAAERNGHPSTAVEATSTVAAEAIAVQPAATARHVAGAEPSDARSSRKARVTAVGPEEPESQAPQSDPQPVATLATLDAVPAIQGAPTGIPVAGPVGSVTGLVSGFLSAVGLNPQTSNVPVAPPQSPVSWTMLGWVRRELGYVFTPVTQIASSTVAATSPMATSPLGTQQQLIAEQVATRTVETLPVQLMKLVLRFGFLSAAQQKFDLVDGPDAANIAALNDAVDEYAMGAAFQQQLLNSMDPTVVMQVAPPHSWYGQDVGGSRILYDNPDTIYRFMGVNKASTYLITGRFTSGVPADTNFSLLSGFQGTTSQNISGSELEINPDGTFTITVSAEAAAVGQKNHLQLTADSTLIAARNTLSDWTSQDPMDLSIQRISGPPNSLFSQLGGFALPVIGPLVVNDPLLTTLVSLIPPLADPPPVLRGVVTAAVMALGIQREAQYITVAATDPTTGKLIQPNVLKNPTRNAEFLATQLQSAGYFQLTDDEALVLTIDPGDAKYFVVPVTNDWTITDDYRDQQTSLNSVQAKPIGGVYTIVISPKDPGVANWVSTGGLNQGTISIRFQDLPLEPTNLPTVTSQVVQHSQLGTVLPAGTLYVTPAQRAAQLAVRKAGFDKRFAPYPQ